MDDLNPNDNDKVFEVEPQAVGEEAAGFSAQAQKDKFLGASSERDDTKTGSRVYEIDGKNFRVNYNTVAPEKTVSGEAPNSENLIVFLPGWSIGASTKTAEQMATGFANAGERNVLIADNLFNESGEDYIFKQSRAIAQLVKESGAKNITIAGYSEGGIKAIDLAAILQKQKEAGETDIDVDGVILMESAGLYDQGGRAGFIGRFAADGLINSAREIVKNYKRKLPSGGRRALSRVASDVVRARSSENLDEARKTGRVSVEVGSRIVKDALRTGIAPYFVEAIREAGAMKQATAHTVEVKAPVILVQGEKDVVINAERVLPGYKTLDNREQALRESLFPNSSYVRMITGEKVSTHGMPVVRSEQVAKTSLYMLERAKREKTPQNATQA